MNSRIGFLVPTIGIPHQKYLFHRYQIISSPDKILIGFWTAENGWLNELHDYRIIAKQNLVWKILNKIYYNYQKLFYKMSKQLFVPILPLGWKTELKKIIEKEQITALIINYAGLGVALLPLLKKLNIPFIVTFDGSDAQVSDVSKIASKRLKELWTISQKNIFVSKFLQQQAYTRGCPSDNSIIVYNSIDIDNQYIYLPLQNPVKLICVANLYPVKGHIYLLKALKKIINHLPDIKLYLAGDGELFQELSAFTIKNKLENNVIFLGRLKWEAVQELLSECNIYIQPSVRAEDGQEEGMPFSTIEAQAKGLPAVVFDSGGLSEVIENNVNGLVVPEKNIDELADAIIKLSTNNTLHEEMSRAAYIRMKKNFNKDNHKKTWNNLSNELLKNN